jgi:hypothetical protein
MIAPFEITQWKQNDFEVDFPFFGGIWFHYL